MMMRNGSVEGFNEKLVKVSDFLAVPAGLLRGQQRLPRCSVTLYLTVAHGLDAQFQRRAEDAVSTGVWCPAGAARSR